jgi:hypothetical protein
LPLIGGGPVRFVVKYGNISPPEIEQIEPILKDPDFWLQLWKNTDKKKVEGLMNVILNSLPKDAPMADVLLALRLLEDYVVKYIVLSQH